MCVPALAWVTVPVIWMWNVKYMYMCVYSYIHLYVHICVYMYSILKFKIFIEKRSYLIHVCTAFWVVLVLLCCVICIRISRIVPINIFTKHACKCTYVGSWFEASPGQTCVPESDSPRVSRLQPAHSINLAPWPCSRVLHWSTAVPQPYWTTGNLRLQWRCKHSTTKSTIYFINWCINVMLYSIVLVLLLTIFCPHL